MFLGRNRGAASTRIRAGERGRAKGWRFLGRPFSPAPVGAPRDVFSHPRPFHFPAARDTPSVTNGAEHLNFPGVADCDFLVGQLQAYSALARVRDGTRDRAQRARDRTGRYAYILRSPQRFKRARRPTEQPTPCFGDHVCERESYRLWNARRNSGWDLLSSGEVSTVP